MQDAVKIYMKQGCPHCLAAMRDHETRGVAYQPLDVKADPAALEEMLSRNGGVRRVPTIVESDRVEVGFKGGF